MTTPNAAGLETTVIRIAAEQVGADPAGVTPSTYFEADLGYDSLDRVEFIMKVEEQFDITIPDEEAEAVRTVGDALGLLSAALRDEPAR